MAKCANVARINGRASVFTAINMRGETIRIELGGCRAGWWGKNVPHQLSAPVELQSLRPGAVQLRAVSNRKA